MYADNNEKAFKFGEAYLNQWEPKLREMNEQHRDMLINGVKLVGRIPNNSHHKTLSERRADKLEKFSKDFENQCREFTVLKSAVEKLKNPPASWEPLDEKDVLILKRHYRSEIARITGDSPRKYVED